MELKYLDQLRKKTSVVSYHGGAKLQVTDHRSGYRSQATGQVTGQTTGHRSDNRPQVRSQVRPQVTHKDNRTLDKTVLD